MLILKILIMFVMVFNSFGVTYCIDNFSVTSLDSQPTIENPVYNNSVLSIVNYSFYGNEWSNSVTYKDIVYYELFNINLKYKQKATTAEIGELFQFLNTNTFNTRFVINNVTYFCDSLIRMTDYSDVCSRFTIYVDFSSLQNLRFSYISVQDSSLVATDVISVYFDEFNNSFFFGGVSYNSIFGSFDGGRFVGSSSNSSLNLFLPNFQINYNTQNYYLDTYYYASALSFKFGSVMSQKFNYGFTPFYNNNLSWGYWQNVSFDSVPLIMKLLLYKDNFNNSYPLRSNMVVNNCINVESFNTDVLDDNTYYIRFSYGFQSDFNGFNLNGGGATYGNLDVSKFYRQSSGIFDIFTAVYNLFVYLIFEAPIFKDIFSFIALIIGFLKDCLNLLIDFIGSFGYFGIIFVGLLSFEIILKLLL